MRCLIVINKITLIQGLIAITAFSCLLGVAAAQPEIDWVQTFGGADFDTGYSVQATPDGGYIIAGATISYSENDWTDCWLVKVDSEGKYEWSKVYGNASWDEGFSVLVTPNGDYVVAGYIDSSLRYTLDASLWFVSSDGSDFKQIFYGLEGNDCWRSVVSTDDGYLIAGFADNKGFWNLYVIKTDESGNTIFSKNYSNDNNRQVAWSIYATSDGGYIIAGESQSPEGVYLLKAAADGGIEWARGYGGTSGNSVQKASDGGYVVAGTCGEGVYLVKVHSDGVMAWSKTYGGSTGNSLQVTPDGGYLIAGSSSEGIYLVKTDKDGNKEWTKTYREGTSGNSLIITPDGNYVIVGYTQPSGEESRDMIILSTDLDPEAGFTYGPKSPSEGNSVKFIDTSTSSPDEIVEWSWDFGVDSSNEQNPAYTFNDDGTYKITLTVTDDDGSTDTISQIVGVKDRDPTAEFESNPSSPMKGDTVRFTDSSTSTPDSLASWSWDFGGQGTSTQQNPEFTFNEAGAYTVQLTVKDDDGSTDTVTHQVTVTQPASTARFSAEPEPQVEGSAIQFTDESISPGEVVSWIWDFGGQGTSTKQNPSYTFTEDGNYLITLTITDDAELTSTATKTVTVTDLLPTSGFTWTPESPAEGSAIEFTDQSSSYPDEITSYAWDFDGQGTSTDPSPTYTFMKDGSCTVSLTVTDTDGSTSTHTQTVTVSNVQPTADFTWTPDQCKAGATVTFTDKSTCYPNDTVSCQWDFGDGSSPSDDVNPSHTYTEKGSYTVKLTVTDVDGDIDTAMFTIAVAAKPLPLGLILGVLVIAGAAAAYYFLVYKKKKTVTPTMLRVTVTPAELPADGRSTAEVMVEVLDEAGVHTEISADTMVDISSTLGSVKSPVTIAEGDSSATTVFTAGFDVGTVNVSATAPGLKSGKGVIQLVEKRRYCMHCGSQMPLNENTCPKCGKIPPSGVEVKECKNCGVVIPEVALFCGDCGAQQPKEPDGPEDE